MDCELTGVVNCRMDMTWRDMQHIVVMTARLGNLKASDWVTNGVGRRGEHSYIMKKSNLSGDITFPTAAK